MTSPKNGTGRLPQRGIARRIADYRVAQDVTSSVILKYLEALDCPRSLSVWLLVKYEEFEQLVDLEFVPDHYNGLEPFRAAYLASEFLSKFQDFPMELDKEAAALEKFEKFESRCKQTNARFRELRGQNFRNSDLGPILFSMSYKISLILGEFSATELFDSCDWGPGASTLIKRRDASNPHKFRCEIGITRKLYNLLCPDGSLSILRGYSPLWCKSLISSGFPLFQRGNKVTTVPKSSKIDRIIAMEPGLNLWFQKGVGTVFRKRLRKWGIDLRYQSRNQALAKRGSLTNGLATVDFSSASDSIALELVRELLPDSWYELLMCLRSDSGSYGGKSSTWEKFSSMGNAFTFELETLIFYTLALACAEREKVPVSEISVYGDDVIIPSTLISSFRYFSEALGFSFNQKKTHSDSPFRESCGAHWYNGCDIKPVYLKGRLNTVQSVYRLANAIRRLSHRMGGYLSCDSRFRDAFYFLVHRVPKSFRFWIPETLGDGGFISNFDEAVPRRVNTRKLLNDYEGYQVRHVVDRSFEAEVEHDGLHLSHLRALERLNVSDMSRTSSRNNVAMKDQTHPVITNGSVQWWYNLGDWF